jgi:hypothetical protein
VADYALSIVQVDTIDTHPEAVEASTVIASPEYVFERSEAPGDPWTRTPRNVSDWTGAFDNPGRLGVYQDVIDDNVRHHATNVTSKVSFAEGFPRLTVLTCDIDMRELAHIPVPDLPSGVPDLALVGRLEVAYDETGLIQRWRFQLDEGRMRGLLSSTSTEVPLAYSAKVSAINDTVDVQPPTEFVDAPAP